MACQPKYPEQLARVKRWYARFEEIAKGRLHDQDSEHYRDVTYAFFMNCYHLKDWIKNDCTAGTRAQTVESFIDGSSEMSLCADICNAHKHLVLTSSRSGQNPQRGPTRYEVGLDSAPATIAVQYTIDTASGPVDAFSLATKCVAAWEKWLGI